MCCLCVGSGILMGILIFCSKNCYKPYFLVLLWLYYDISETYAILAFIVVYQISLIVSNGSVVKLHFPMDLSYFYLPICNVESLNRFRFVMCIRFIRGICICFIYPLLDKRASV